MSKGPDAERDELKATIARATAERDDARKLGLDWQTKALKAEAERDAIAEKVSKIKKVLNE